MARQICTICNPVDRYAPPQVAGELARALEDGGVMDEYCAIDQLTSWYPTAAFIPKYTPLANTLPDQDAFQDVMISAAFVAAMTKGKIDLALTTDAIRRAPAELLQALLTLGDGIGKPVTLHLGAGEVKQMTPFGYNRKEGLGRQEDLLVIMRKLLDTDGMITHEGKYWHYKDAWIGGAKKFPPKIFALGGGPKLLELAVKYCDGISAVVPGSFATPEEFAQFVKALREGLEREGRDPAKFTFGVWYMTMVDNGTDDMEAVMQNGMVKWYAAMAGRLHSKDWRKEGLEPVLPDDYFYALNGLLAWMTPQEVDEIVARTPREIVKRSFLIGSPREVAAQMAPYTEVGANYHMVADNYTLVGRPTRQTPESVAHLVETCRIFKEIAA